MVDRFRAIIHVLKQESTVSLGLAGRKLEIAVANLRRHDAANGSETSLHRQELVRNAAYLLAAFVIQREALGIRNHFDLNELFGLTPELWSQMGVR